MSEAFLYASSYKCQSTNKMFVYVNGLSNLVINQYCFVVFAYQYRLTIFTF